MFKAKTLADFEQLQKTVELLNKDDIWKLRLEVKHEYSECDLYVIDETEELYYGGFAFDRVMETLNKALRFDTGNNNAYFDCICQGKWLADFDGRSRYTEKDMVLDIDIAIGNAMLKYMEDNDLKPDWTDELRDKFEELSINALRVIKEILHDANKKEE